MELWDAAFIDLLGPGYIRFYADGGSEFSFGAVQGEIDGDSGSDSVHFTCGATMRWTTPAAAMPDLRRTAPSPLRSDSMAATKALSQSAAGSFSAAC
jgi:hypothetical protein